MSAQNWLIVNQCDSGTEPCSLIGSGEASRATPDYSHIGVSVLMVSASFWFSPVINLT
jgi:hypothetical protein